MFWGVLFFGKILKNLIINYLGIPPLPPKPASNLVMLSLPFGDALQVLVSENFFNVHKIKKHVGGKHV